MALPQENPTSRSDGSQTPVQSTSEQMDSQKSTKETKAPIVSNKSGLSQGAKIAIGCGATVAGVAGACLAAPVMLAAAGFGSVGITGGSLAAAYMSSVGTVAAGGMFATLQSAGMAGLGALGLGVAGTVGAAVGGGVGALTALVIFTDEKVFSSACHGRRHVWRRRGTRFQPQNILPSRRSGRITGAMWGWVSYFSLGELAEIEGMLTAEKYIDILENVLIPSVRATVAPHPEDVYIVHDRSPIHTSRLVREWIREHPDLHFLPWPPKGADLNPIENLWGIMVQSCQDNLTGIRRREDLFLESRRTWESFRRNPTILENLIDSMPRRLQECIENGGNNTHY